MGNIMTRDNMRIDNIVLKDKRDLITVPSQCVRVHSEGKSCVRVVLHWSEILPQRVSSGAEHIITEGGILDRLDSRLDTVWADSMCCGGQDDGAVVVVIVVVTIVVTIIDATTDTAITAIQSGAFINNCCH